MAEIEPNPDMEMEADPAPANGAQPVEIRKAERAPRPTRSLPTNRIAFTKQLDALRAFVAASGLNRKPVTLTEVGGIVQISPATLSLNNNFLVESGLLNRVDTSHLLPADSVYEFVRAHEWQPESATEKLADTLRGTWYYQAIEPRLKYSPLNERLVVQYLAEAAGASPDYEQQLQLLLSWLEASGLISRDGGTVRLVNAARLQVPAHEPPAAKETEQESPSAIRQPVVTSTFTHQPEGMITFAVSVRIDVTELRDWRPERITALFGGIAQVLAAKGNVETGATQS